ncbi:MAG: UDP-N-acetylmuramate dehydrogenase [Cryobacterium sp.]|nr:UDP-N-acetylmuramate dehydrogenase [Cryobacterium sp.]
MGLNLRFADLTTLKVGGEIATFHEAATTPEVIELVKGSWREHDEMIALGGGSNLLASDDEYPGTVIKISTRGITQTGAGSSDGKVLLTVQAGELWDDVARFACESGLSGIEALSGIPGSAGAAPVQNIGAYGQELCETLESIEFLDERDGEIKTLPAGELDLGYRTSSLKQGRRGIVLSICLALERTELSAPIAYSQLAAKLGVELGSRVELAEARQAVLELRASKGMLLQAGDPDSVSAGSFFTNPIVSENFARNLPKDCPHWILDPEAPESAVKLSAAWLIEHSGIQRGFSLPGSSAAVSSKHTLALTNRGNATAEEIMQLARYIHLRVLSQFGVALQPEPVLLGLSL